MTNKKLKNRILDDITKLSNESMMVGESDYAICLMLFAGVLIILDGKVALLKHLSKAYDSTIQDRVMKN